MAQRVSKREQAAVEQLRRERDGTAGLVQCEGCPDTMLVPESIGVCERHLPVSPHLAEVYDDNRTYGQVLWESYHSDADW